jgi:type IV secretion system protein VirD4
MAGLVAFGCRLALITACLTAVAGIALIGAAHPVLAAVAVGLACWQRLRSRPVTDSYGSATVASTLDMERGGLLQDRGVILGRCLPDRPTFSQGVGLLLCPAAGNEIAVRSFLAATLGGCWLSERLIRTSDHINIATFSPAGGGKGVAAAIPNLLAHPGNWVIVDPKGELYRECARHRQQRFHKRIYRLDPFEDCGPGGDCLNPYDFIRPEDDDFLDQCRDFAHPIIIREKEEKQPHFNDMAELLLVALTAWVCGCQKDRERRHLGIVRGIASSRDLYRQALDLMQKTDDCQGVIRLLGDQIAFPAQEEEASILSTFTRQTAFLDSPAVLRNVKRSTFDPLDLKKGNADLFLILPANRLKSLQRLQRLWITTVMARASSGVPDESTKTYWLLDEFAHIGSMPAVEEAVTLKRGMGMRLWFILQSLGQAKTCFGEKASEILDNIGTQQYFGINSFETADELSKRIGDATIAITSVNDTRGDSKPTGPSANGPTPGSVSTSCSVTRSEIARRILKPEEILTIDKNICLIFHKNLPVCLGRLVRYYEAREFRRGWFGLGLRGTARPRRLGLGGAVASTLALFASTLVTTMGLLAAGIVAPPASALPAGTQATGAVIRAPRGSALAAPQTERMAAKAAAPLSYARAAAGPGNGKSAQKRYRRRGRGPSGFLIKIE